MENVKELANASGALNEAIDHELSSMKNETADLERRLERLEATMAMLNVHIDRAQERLSKLREEHGKTAQQPQIRAEMENLRIALADAKATEARRLETMTALIEAKTKEMMRLQALRDRLQQQPLPDPAST